MGKCVEKLPHRTDKCNSANGLQVFLEDNGKYTGYCFACGTHVLDPYGDKPAGYKPHVAIKTQEQIQAELAEIGDCLTVDLPERKLRKESLEYFGVKIGLSETDGVTPETHYYPYRKNGELVAYKVRLIKDKRMWAIGSTKDVDLFGWQEAIQAGGKKLFITEGELDAVALFQIFKDHNKGTPYADFNPAIVSLSNGAGGAPKEITKFLPEIKKHFKEVILVFDMDIPGREAAEKVLKSFPEALVANLPAKDANDCLIEGRGKACYNACQFNAAKPKNTRLVRASSLHEKAKVAPAFGMSWPWNHITNATRGIRFGETIYIGAGQKQKSADQECPSPRELHPPYCEQ